MSTLTGSIKSCLTRNIRSVSLSPHYLIFFLFILKNSDIVFSCSNDTTIKLWSVKGIYEQGVEDDYVSKIGAMVTLNDDSDYIRAIDYSSFNNSLYSCCDNGIVRQWEVELAKIVTQYSPGEVSVIMMLMRYLSEKLR